MINVGTNYYPSTRLDIFARNMSGTYVTPTWLDLVSSYSIVCSRGGMSYIGIQFFAWFRIYLILGTVFVLVLHLIFYKSGTTHTVIGFDMTNTWFSYSDSELIPLSQCQYLSYFCIQSALLYVVLKRDYYIWTNTLP